MTVIATEEQLENRVKFGTMPGLSTIGFDKVAVSGTLGGLILSSYW